MYRWGRYKSIENLIANITANFEAIFSFYCQSQREKYFSSWEKTIFIFIVNDILKPQIKCNEELKKKLKKKSFLIIILILFQL